MIELDGIGRVAIGVLVTLFAMSVASIGIIVERALAYRAAARQSRACLAAAVPLLRKRQLGEALSSLEKPGLAQSPVASCLASGLREWREHSESTAFDLDIALLGTREALRSASLQSHGELRKGLGALATIGSTAPFVGLFGTTFGIINAFAAIGLTGATSMAAMSAGISEALVTTAFGLVVAVPAVWAYNFFGGRVEALQVEADRASSALIAALMRASS
jgi:biopolymer transport protein ExbB/biopolymer transport protein TolQ